MELGEDTLTVSRNLSELDREVLGFTSLLSSLDVDYVVVSGYVAILAGRSRSTEDVDVILAPLTESRSDELVTTLDAEGYWGMAMPLEEAFAMWSEGDRLRIASEGEVFPNFETWFASNDVEREALAEALTVEFDGGSVEISPIELQIAYKLRLAERAGTTSGKDFEDALHLYLTFEERFNRDALEGYVEELDVETYYAELRRV